MSDDIFNLDDFVSQEPVAKKQKAPDDYNNSEFTMEPAVVVKEVAVAGKDGADGKDGLDGTKGADGIGIDGAKGLDGSDGTDGVSVVDTFVQGDDLFVRLSDGKLINTGNVRGPQGYQGLQGSGGGKGYRGGGNNTKSANHFGFADYNDTSTATTPLTIVGETWTTLPNNGAGSFSQESLPLLLSNTLLGAGGSLDVSEMALGSDLLIRPDFTVTPSANNSSLSFRFQLGAGAGAYTLEQQLGRLDLGAGVPYRFSLQALYVYLGDTNTRDNPISLQIKLSGNGSAVNAGLALKVYSL